MSVLYIVATPIGNLEDITRRALRILSEVDVIACEDTRRSLKLLNHYKIQKPLVSFHSHNQRRVSQRILTLLEQDKQVALITDGGTPGVSDPGAYLVAQVRQRGLRVIPIPGPSALATLLSVTGDQDSGVVFAGFLSPKPGKRRRRLAELLAPGTGIVLFESPHRILKLLADLKSLAPKRNLLLGKEMTKIHENFFYGFPEEVLTELSERGKIAGEFSIFVCPDKKVQVDRSQ